MQFSKEINKLADSLTLEQKIGQTSQERLCDLQQWSHGDIAGFLERYPLGSIFAGNEIIGVDKPDVEKQARLIDRWQKESALPLSVSGDLENGAGGAAPGMTSFVSLLGLGATGDEEAAYQYGKYTALEGRKAGFNWVLGPVADLSINWLNPAVGSRCLGSAPEKVAGMLDALIRGYQENGISATAKHFPGDGVDFRDQHLVTSVNAMPKDQWMESFGAIYRVCFEAGVHSIMAGHIALPWMDAMHKKNGHPIPASASRKILTTLLRDELNFDGVVISDALIMGGFCGWADDEARLIDAFNAGVDVMLWPGREYLDIMQRAIQDGRISMERLNQSVCRVLSLKQKQGILQTRPSLAENFFPEPQAQQYARDLANKSITLVRNEDRLLPLDKSTTKTMLVLLATPKEDNARERMAPFIRTAESMGIHVDFKINGNCLDLLKLEESGTRYDSLLCFFELGMHQLKNTLRPTGAMAECIWMIQNTNCHKPIVISLGTPYVLNDLPFAQTVINTYSSSEQLLEELARGLFGGFEFSGKSPVDTGGKWF